MLGLSLADFLEILTLFIIFGIFISAAAALVGMMIGVGTNFVRD